MNLDLAYKHLDKYLGRIIASNDVTDAFHICIELRRFLLEDVIFSEIVESRSGLYNEAMNVFSTQVILLFKEIRTFTSEIEKHCSNNSTIQKKLAQLTFTPEFDFRAANIDTLHYYTYSPIKNLFSSAHALRLVRRIKGFKDNRFELADDAQSFITPLIKLCFDFFEKLHSFALEIRRDSSEPTNDWIEEVSKPCIKTLRFLAQSFNYVTYYNHTKDWIEFLLLSYEEPMGIHDRTNNIHTLLARSRATNEIINTIVSRIIFDCQEEIVKLDLKRAILSGIPSREVDSKSAPIITSVTREQEEYSQRHVKVNLLPNELAYSTRFGNKEVFFVLAVTNIGKPPILRKNKGLYHEQQESFISKCWIDNKVVFKSKEDVKSNHLRLLCALLLDSIPGNSSEEYLDKSIVKTLVKNFTSPDQIRNHARVLHDFLKDRFNIQDTVVKRHDELRGKWLRDFPIAKAVK